MTLEEAKTKAYPDGGGKYEIDGKSYRVHCDEYHMHSFKCLVEFEDYQPYGKEWENEMMKFKKVELINLLRSQYIKGGV